MLRLSGDRRRADSGPVQVFLRAGRSDDLKRAFHRTLAENVAALGVQPRDLMVVLTENTLSDWSFGNGVAQYLLAGTSHDRGRHEA